MKHIRKTVFALFAILLSCRNSILPIEPVPEDMGMIHAPGIVRLHDSTLVWVALPGDSSSMEAVQWSVDRGRIVGNGYTALFLAPSDTGAATIRMSSRMATGIVRDSARIRIYKQIIILKADDFSLSTSTPVSPNWQRFVHFIIKKNIKAGLGLKGKSLFPDNKNYREYIKTLARSGHFEFWNHGYDHIVGAVSADGNKYDEFRNTPLGYQIEQLMRTQNLAKEKLGLTLHAFGAPGNAIDENTCAAMAMVPDLKIWFFGMETPGKLNLPRRGEIEFPVHCPDYVKFIQTYDSTRSCQVYQVHPDTWNDTRFEEFKKIIDFLLAHQVHFFNPYEYYKALADSI
ncbi:hypothetical protein JW777_01575 [bacterium]|nr:hypothetical protein [bacterium]